MDDFVQCLYAMGDFGPLTHIVRWVGTMVTTQGLASSEFGK